MSIIPPITAGNNKLMVYKRRGTVSMESWSCANTDQTTTDSWVLATMPKTGAGAALTEKQK